MLRSAAPNDPPTSRHAPRHRHATRHGSILDPDDRGQMMLLAAIVMVVGFIALSGMLSRVAQLSELTVSEQEEPILREMETVARGVALMANVTVKANPGCTTDTDNATTAAMAHIRRIEASRGFSMINDPPACTVVDADTDRIVVRYWLTDGLTSVGLTVTREVDYP